MNLSAAAKLAGYSFYHMQTVVGKRELEPATTYLDGVGKRLPLFLASDVVSWRDSRKRTTHTNKETRRGQIDTQVFLAGGGVVRKKG